MKRALVELFFRLFFGRVTVRPNDKRRKADGVSGTENETVHNVAGQGGESD